MTQWLNQSDMTKVITRSFMPFPILSTSRLMLRQLLLNDEHEIFNLRSDIEINRYLGRQLSKTLEDARNFITKINENTNKNDSLYWAITLVNTGKLIGTVCLFDFSDENCTCELGYELLKNYQGRGIMKEAVEKVIDYAFKTINVQKIKAFPHRNNQRSINLLEKLCFKRSNDPEKIHDELIGYNLIHPGDNSE